MNARILLSSTLFGPIRGRYLLTLTNQRPGMLLQKSVLVSLQQSGLCQAEGKNCISLYCAMWDGGRINLAGILWIPTIYFWNSLWDQSLTQQLIYVDRPILQNKRSASFQKFHKKNCAVLYLGHKVSQVTVWAKVQMSDLNSRSVILLSERRSHIKSLVDTTIALRISWSINVKTFILLSSPSQSNPVQNPN